MDRSFWILIVVSWFFNLCYVGTIFYFIFYGILESIKLMFK